MSSVWIVEAEHHSVPGRVLKVCASRESADKIAAELVSTLTDTQVEPAKWQEALDAYLEARERDDLDAGYVEVDQLPLIP